MKNDSAIFMNHIAEMASNTGMPMFGDEAAKDQRINSWNKVCFIYSLVPVEVYRFFSVTL